MSKSDDDEFENVIKGLPEENVPKNSGMNFVVIFTVVGVLFSLFIIVFQDTIFSQWRLMYRTGNGIFQQVIVSTVLAFLVGGVQAWIFKNRIKSRIYVYIGFSILGGCIAGVVGGFLMNLGNPIPALIGFVSGAVAGGISSSGQNTVMGNQKYKTKWAYFSICSWAVIFSISWMIGWDPKSGVQMALSALFLLISSGASLAVFLNSTPQIEFT